MIIMLEVVVAIIIKDGKTLIAKRKQGKMMGGSWEFPGGKTETGETLEHSVIRELKEEMDVDVRVGELIAEIDYNYEWGDVHLIAFHTEIIGGQIKLLEHDEMAWVTMNQMSEYGMTPADEPLIEMIKKWLDR